MTRSDRGLPCSPARPGLWGIAINNTVKPFNDVRVRKALTLGIDRYTMG